MLSTKLHQELADLLASAGAGLGASVPAASLLERPRQAEHGDFASNLAMRVAKQLGKPPLAIAEQLAEQLAAHDCVAEAVAAKPGFVNIKLTPAARAAVVTEALDAGARFGAGPASGQRILLEFVSANPTGPLHIGHGRAAAVGDSLARILRHAGFAVDTEYYLNDKGLQTDVLAASVWLRALARRGRFAGPLPAGAYQGDYLVKVAEELLAAMPEIAAGSVSLDDLPANEDEAAAALAGKAEKALGERFAAVRKFAIDAIVASLKTELAAFRVEFDSWFSERELAAGGAVETALAALDDKDALFDKDGATWFRASAHGDEKDWVVRRGNGQLTYFGTDIAYHQNKLDRGYDLLYVLVGADHHGYIARLRASLAALGHDPERLEFGILQFVSLVNADQRVKMSTRAGRFLPLQELVDAVGVAATRLMFVFSKGDAPLEFDVERTASQTADNPVYYVQYAHARSCSLLAKGGWRQADAQVAPELLTEPEAAAVMAELWWFATTVECAARERAPHRIAHWLVALAAALHRYYDKVPVLSGAPEAIPSRLALVAATRQALACGLELLGVDAPDKM